MPQKTAESVGINDTPTGMTITSSEWIVTTIKRVLKLEYECGASLSPFAERTATLAFISLAPRYTIFLLAANKKRLTRSVSGFSGSVVFANAS